MRMEDDEMTAVCIRMTYAEYKRIKVKAAEHDQSMTAYMKNKALEE